MNSLPVESLHCFLASNSGWANVLDQRGIGLALTGIAIVFSVLGLISISISAMPRLLSSLEDFFPEPTTPLHASGPPTPAAASSDDSLDESVIAAIGYALHSQRSKE